MRKYRVGRFPLLHRWPQWPASDGAVHLYIGAAARGVCGRARGAGTSDMRTLNCPACWWRLVLLWFVVLLGGGPSENT